MILLIDLAFCCVLVLRGYADRIDTSDDASTYEAVAGCDAYCFRFSADGSILNLPLGTPLSTCRQLMRSELERGNRHGAVEKINSYCGSSCNCKNEDANFEAKNGALSAKASLVEEHEKRRPNENHPEAAAEATNMQATNVGSAVTDGTPTGSLDEDGIVAPSGGVNGYNVVGDGQVLSNASDVGHMEFSDMSKKHQASGGDANKEQRGRRGRKNRFFQRTKRGKRGARRGRQKRRKNRRSNSSRGRRPIDQEQGQGQGQGPRQGVAPSGQGHGQGFQGNQVQKGHQDQVQGQEQGQNGVNQRNQGQHGQGQRQNPGNQGKQRPERASIRRHSRSMAKHGHVGGSAGDDIHAINTASNDINDRGTNPTSNTGGSASNDRETSPVNTGGSVTNDRGSTPAGSGGVSASRDPESSSVTVSRSSSNNDRGSSPVSNSAVSAIPASNSGGSSSNDRGSSPASNRGGSSSNDRGSNPAINTDGSSSNDRGSASSDRGSIPASNGGSASNDRGSNPAINTDGSSSNDRGSATSDRGSIPASNGGSASNDRGSSSASRSGGITNNNRGNSPASNISGSASNIRGSTPASSRIISPSNDIVDTPEKDSDSRGKQGVPAVVVPLPSHKESADGSSAYVPNAHQTKDPKSEGSPVQRMRMHEETKLEAARVVSLISTTSTTSASIGAPTKATTSWKSTHEANASNSSKTPLSVSAALRTTNAKNSAAQPAGKISVLVEAIRKALSIYDREAEAAGEAHVEEDQVSGVDSTAQNPFEFVNGPSKQSDSIPASSGIATNQIVGETHTVESLANIIRNVLDGSIGGTPGKQTQTQ